MYTVHHNRNDDIALTRMLLNSLRHSKDTVIHYNSMLILFQGGWSAVMLASQNGNTEIVKYLIEAKASLDLQTQVYSALDF